MIMQIRVVHRTVHSTGQERRKLMQEEKKQEYALKVQEMLQQVEMKSKSNPSAVFITLEISPQLFVKSQEATLNTPEQVKRAEEMNKRVELAERTEQMGAGYEPLSREDAIKKIAVIEEKKVEYVAGMIIMA